jgi:RNA recognition motif-containing protein
MKIKDREIAVLPFKRKKDREDARKNLYIKNLPQLSEKELTDKLTEICKTFGTISSLLVKTYKDKGRSFAFVCFEDNKQAENAFADLSEMTLDGEKLYVNWAEKKMERTKKLREVYSKS